MILSIADKDIFKGHFSKEGCPYIDIVLNNLIISIEKRNWYCDRGRFSIKICDDKTLMVDAQDAFPRYFFLLENLISELMEFIKFRKYEVKDVLLKNKKEGA